MSIFILLIYEIYRCLLPHEDAKNATFSLSKEDWKKYFPFDEELKDYKSCEYLEDGKEKSCDKYVYDTSVYRTTVVTEVGKRY